MSSLGTFVWHELVARDEKAAAAFYQKITAWGTQPFGGDQPYTLWTVRGTPIGGLTSLPAEAEAMGMPPHWLGYVAVEDVDAACAKLLELGGKVHKPTLQLPEVGDLAIVADPQGAVFALFRASGPARAPMKRGEPGAMSWAELNTSDWESAWKFYESLFGWKKTGSMEMGEPVGTYLMFTDAKGTGDYSMGGMSNVATAMGAPPHWLFYVNVSDIDSALAQTTALGGRVLNGPMDVPGEGKIAQCIDPQGAAFALYADPSTSGSRAEAPASTKR
jgi:predicted enzyme related to lactoylglutathione lyase